MTLGQFATAVGATPRWVLNALTRLEVPRRYSEPLARRLALARMIAETAGASLPGAFRLASRALGEADPYGAWRHESADGAIAVLIDMPRFFTSYGTRLALARNYYGEKLRGRRPRHRGSALERAKAYGLDTTLLEAQLARTPAQRLQDLDESVEFFRRARLAAR